MRSPTTFGFIAGLVLFGVAFVLSRRLPSSIIDSPFILVAGLLLMLFATTRIAESLRDRLIVATGFVVTMFADVPVRFVRAEPDGGRLLALAILSLVFNFVGPVLLISGLVLAYRARQHEGR